MSVLLGNGDGTFQTAVSYAAGAVPSSVTVGDFNGDGILDLAVANDTVVGNVSVLLGNGDGTFQTAVNYALTDQAGTTVTGMQPVVRQNHIRLKAIDFFRCRPSA
jgi:hypothetical protein